MPADTNSVDQIAALLADAYDLGGRLTRLAGENENYRVETGDGERYVLKLAADDLPADFLDLEYRIVEHVSGANLDLQLPHLIPTKDDRMQTDYRAPDGILRGRLLTFVPGTPWSQAGTASVKRMRDLGNKLGALDRALAGFDHPAARRTHRWDLASAAQHRGKASLVDDPDRRRLVEWYFHYYAACASPRLSSLPHSVIHGDANDENVLVEGDRVSGLLDFGDVVYNPTVCNLAIASAYAMLDQADPLRVGAEIVGAYHAVRPLSELELDVLYPLVCGRLCTTVIVAAERRGIDAQRANWFVTEERAWNLLERFSAIDPVQAGNRLLSKTGVSLSPDHGASPEELLEERKRFISPALSIAYRRPLKIVRGEGQYLFDHRGRPFLDLVNNVCHVGHCHPRVVEAGRRQMALLNTNTRYLYAGLTEYARRLCATLPDDLDTCFFVNSGSEANELALRLAMTHTGRRDFLVVDGAYHGHTARLIDLSPYKFMGAGGRGKAESWVHVVPMPDGYRGAYKGAGREVGVAYGDEVKRVIAAAKAPIAGFLVESLMSCAGQIVPPPGYLETAFAHVRAVGGVCIVDEVQVGFGRAGTHFWAFERQGVVPDMVVLGKPIGNGHPMGAVITTASVADSFANGMEFFSTFGGNPVSCAIGLAVLDVIRDEDLQTRALELGTRLQHGLQELKGRHEIIGDVRGTGLFVGVELVRDRSALEPANDEADELINRMQARGMLLSTDGPFHNVIKIKPPMVLNGDDVDMFVRGLDDELAAIKKA